MYIKLTFDENIELGQMTETEVNFEIIKDWIYTPAYATKKSIKQSEFYNAATIGMKPELVFVVRDFEYQNHERLKYNNVTYEIIRAYEIDDVVELIVTTWSGSDV